MKTILIIFSVILVSSGCSSSSSKHIYMSDGSEAYKIECDGMNPCYDRAGAICGRKGYQLLDQSGGPGEHMTTIVIKCR